MAAGLPQGVYSVWIINKSGGLIFQRVRRVFFFFFFERASECGGGSFSCMRIRSLSRPPFACGARVDLPYPHRGGDTAGMFVVTEPYTKHKRKKFCQKLGVLLTRLIPFPPLPPSSPSETNRTTRTSTRSTPTGRSASAVYGAHSRIPRRQSPLVSNSSRLDQDFARVLTTAASALFPNPSPLSFSAPGTRCMPSRRSSPPSRAAPASSCSRRTSSTSTAYRPSQVR